MQLKLREQGYTDSLWSNDALLAEASVLYDRSDGYKHVQIFRVNEEELESALHTCWANEAPGQD